MTGIKDLKPQNISVELKTLALVLAVTSGIIIGFASSSYLDEGKSKCEKTEETIRQDSNLSGAIACFEPGVISVNLSDRVEEGSELECVCRRSYKGNIQLWAINSANP